MDALTRLRAHIGRRNGSLLAYVRDRRLTRAKKRAAVAIRDLVTICRGEERGAVVLATRSRGEADFYFVNLPVYGVDVEAMATSARLRSENESLRAFIQERKHRFNADGSISEQQRREVAA